MLTGLVDRARAAGILFREGLDPLALRIDAARWGAEMFERILWSQGLMKAKLRGGKRNAE